LQHYRAQCKKRNLENNTKETPCNCAGRIEGLIAITEFIESKSTLSLCLNGDNKVDALTLSNIIKNIAEISDIVASEQNPDAQLSVEVVAFKQGSFEIAIEFISCVASTLAPIATSVTVYAIGTYMSEIIKGNFEAKKLSKGEKPKKVYEIEDGQVKIEFSSGECIVLPKGSEEIFRNKLLDGLVSDTSSLAQKKDGFKISTEKNTSNYTKEDLHLMSLPFSHETNMSDKSFVSRPILPIKKADVLGDSAWSFRYESRTINAAMQDEAFMRRIHSGSESITAGDSIEATMLTEITTDDSGLVLKTKYTVQEVHGDIIRIKQLSFWDDV